MLNNCELANELIETKKLVTEKDKKILELTQAVFNQQSKNQQIQIQFEQKDRKIKRLEQEIKQLRDKELCNNLICFRGEETINDGK